MATQSSILAWRIPWTGEPGGFLSTGSQRVGHDRSDFVFARKATIIQYCYTLQQRGENVRPERLAGAR